MEYMPNVILNTAYLFGVRISSIGLCSVLYSRKYDILPSKKKFQIRILKSIVELFSNKSYL